MVKRVWLALGLVLALALLPSLAVPVTPLLLRAADAYGPRTPTSRSRGSGTRRCSMPSAVTSRRRPCTRETCSTSQLRCGMPGPPTTRTADGVFVTQKIVRDDPTGARKRAISYAAYRVLSHRYGVLSAAPRACASSTT